MTYVKAALLIAIATLLGWRAVQAYQVASQLRDRSRVLEEVKHRPVRVVDSPIVTRPQHLFVGERACAAAPDDSAQTLVLIFGSQSAKSADASRDWARFVTSRPWSPGQSVWVVADDHVSALSAPFSSVPPEVVCRLRMTSPGAFIEQTGIRAVPAALLFRGRQLQLMGAGPIDADQFAVFDRHLTRDREQSPASPFFFDEPGEPILVTAISQQP